MSEIVVESTPIETVIEIDDGPTLSTVVNETVQTVVSEPAEPLVVDLNSGPRGEPGSSLLTGPYPPPLEAGSVGDIYLVAEGISGIGDIYRKTLVNWTEVGNIRGPAGGIASVNGKLGPEVILTKNDIDLALVDNTADADKPVSTLQQAALDLKANASDTVNLTGAQTIAGVKTFSSAPVVPDNAFTIPKVSGLQGALDLKANLSAAVMLSGNQTISGIKTFTTDPVLQGVMLNINTPTSATLGWARGVTFRNEDGTTVQGGIGMLGQGTNVNHFYIGMGVNPYDVSVGLKIAPDGVSTFTSSVTATSFIGSGASLSGLTKSQVGLANVDNTSDANKPVSTAQAESIATKVSLTGNETVAGVKTFSSSPIIPTPSSDMQAATKKYIDDAILVLTNGSPALLNTLDELAQAIGDDPNFATTMTNALAGKQATIVAGTIAQYYRGDKTWQTLDKAAVGLSNVDNTSDSAKPVSTAQASAIASKQDVLNKSTLTTTVDLNTLTTTGHYQTANHTGANFPAGAYGYGTLQVISGAPGNNVVTQNYYPHVASGTGMYFTRTKFNASDWQPWITMVDANNAQTIAGVKTFSTAPVVPDASFTVAKTSGLQTALDGKVSLTATETIAGTKTFSSRIVVLGTEPNAFISSTAGTSNGAASLEIRNTAAGGNHAGIYFHVPTVVDGILRLNTNGRLQWTNSSGTAMASAGIEAALFTGSGAGLSNLPATSLTGTIPQARLAVNVLRFEHGSNASTARPTGATYVDWVGSVMPSNMAAGDTWINTSTNGNVSDLQPAGTVIATATAKSVPPATWYFMEGQEILISGDTALYNELTNNGTVFPHGPNTNGAGAAGGTHFRLPNSKGKTIVHADGTTEFSSVGTSFGTKSVTLTTAQIPAHTHFTTLTRQLSAVDDGNYSSDVAAGDSGTLASIVKESSSAGGGGAHNNIQPSLVLRYIIKR